MKRIRLLALIFAGVLGAAGIALALPSPRAELAAMRRAVNSEHSVHYVSVNHETGYDARTVSDVGPGTGIQKITVSEFGHTGPAEVRVAHKVAYIKGTVLTLDIFFGFNPAQAKQYGGKWISIPYANPAFAVVADGATYESFAASIYPVGQLHLFTTGHLIGVRGAATTTGRPQNKSIFAPDHGKPLPVKEETSAVDGSGTDVWTMSHWNEAVHVSVPKGAVPIDVVTGG